MGKFEKEAREMLEAIGGKDNIAAVTHCATRMRFVLNDDSKADVKRLEAIPAVKGTFTNAGQFQAIIGNDVPIFIMILQRFLVLKVFQKKRLNQQRNAIKIGFSVPWP
ncbi:PTS transporter subunit EIIB [Streptococcus alactolyticus]|uniref:PTS transporter subunit EIIB n=1 Tax=Streptococcus alactolyticus TaxID=29389 RepID=UPI003B8A8E2D